MDQLLRIYACLACLAVGGCGGAVLLDGTLGERQRDRARRPGEFACGGAGVDVYLAGGFVAGVMPAAWLLRRAGAGRWVAGAAAPVPPEVDAAG